MSTRAGECKYEVEGFFVYCLFCVSYINKGQVKCFVLVSKTHTSWVQFSKQLKKAKSQFVQLCLQLFQEATEVLTMNVPTVLCF